MDPDKLERLGRLRLEARRLEEELGLSGAVGALPEGGLPERGLGSEAYELIARCATDFISIHAANGDYLFASVACRTLLGLEPEELLGRNAYERFHPEDLARIAASHAQHGGGGGTPTVSYRLRTAKDTWLWVETVSHAHSVEVEGGSEVQQIICITRDITERKLAESALLEAKARLEQFATTAAHDIKGPLTTIAGYAELLALNEGGRLTVEELRRLGQISRACVQLAAQVDGLLDWAQSGREARPDRPTDLARLVDEVLAGLSAELEIVDATVEVGPLPRLPLDPALGRVLVQNLVGNAIKYRLPGRPPRVGIFAERDDGHWHLRFVDNGRGVDESDRKRIFGMFRRGRGVEGQPGYGVGLAMCARITEIHKGSIWVDDNPGGGATFHVKLPGGEGADSEGADSEDLAED